MAKINISIRQLFIYDQQCQAKKGSIDWHFDAGKIKAFYNENEVRLKSAYEKRDTILKEFCVLESGLVKFKDEKTQEPELIEGKELADFTKAMEELLRQEVAVEI